VADETPKEAAKKSGPNLIVIILLVLVLALAGVAFWMWKHQTVKVVERAPEKPKVESVVQLEPFVLNLSDTEQKSYLRVGVEIGVSKAPSKEKKEGAGESGPPIALVRDAILEVLAAGKSSDLLTPDGKTKLKEDILAALRKRAPDMGAEEVYFTEFLVQR
jgi:flagellar FliL protein